MASLTSYPQFNFASHNIRIARHMTSIPFAVRSDFGKRADLLDVLEPKFSKKLDRVPMRSIHYLGNAPVNFLIDFG